MIEPEWIWIPVKAQVKQRPRLGRRRKAYTPPKTLEFETAIREYWDAHGQGNWGDVPLSVSVEIERDGFWVLIEPLEAFHRPVGVLGDVDNYVKSILDGLQGAAYDNDKQIEQFTVALSGPPRKPRKKVSDGKA